MIVREELREHNDRAKEIVQLRRKVSTGEATPKDRERYQLLLQQRQPNVLSRYIFQGR